MSPDKVQETNARTNQLLRRLAIITAVLFLALNAITAGAVIWAVLDIRNLAEAEINRDRFLTRQALINDLDTIEHRIAEKERARCEERFIKDVVLAVRSGGGDAAIEAVTGCFGPKEAVGLADLYAKRDGLLQQIDRLPITRGTP